MAMAILSKSIEELFDDDDYMTEEEFLQSYEYVETINGVEHWQLKPDVFAQIKLENGITD